MAGDHERPAKRSRWLCLIYAYVAVTAVVAVGYAYALHEDQRRSEIVLVDFTAADSRNNLYPMDDRLPHKRLPRQIELRFPDGRVYLDEEASSVEIHPDYHAPGGVQRVLITSKELDVHEAYGQARRLRDDWRIPESTAGQLDRWYEDHLATPTRNPYSDQTKVECEAASTDVGAARLHISVEIWANTVLRDYYHLFIVFSWGPPDAKARKDRAWREEASTGTTVLRAPKPVC
jgi:hypothetical protein